MTPLLASPDFTGFTEDLVCYGSWIISAALCFAAFVFAFPRRTRAVSGWLALGCMILWPVSALALAAEVAALHSHGESLWQRGDPFWRDAFLFCAPMVVALAVYYLARRGLKRNREIVPAT